MTRQENKKSKVRFFTENQEQPGTGFKKYLLKLNRKEASMIFKARTRMLKVKDNYKTQFKKEGLMCRACKKEQETQNHILYQCHALHTSEKTKVNANEIFSERSIKLLSETAKNYGSL